MKFLIKLKKCISIITASCLLISFVIGPTTANAMTNEEATAKYKQIFKDFMLPYNYGQITSAHYAGTDRVIINIQDLHCHPKVQKNISNIIETFDKNYGVKKVYLEGAYGNVSTKWLIDRLDNSNKMEMLDKILETGRLTGAEYYSAMTGKANIINGLEEKAPYLDNLKRFGEIIENQDNINLILQAIDDSLLKLKQQYYTKRQYKLEELSNNYREGKISSQKYYALLYKHIDKLGIDISKYENMFTYMMLLELQKKLDYSKITNELQNLVLFLRENLPNSAYQMLVDNTENFSKMDKLYGYVVRISRQLNLDLTVNFPNLDNYFGYIEFSQKINPLQLIVEEKKLTEEINTRFSETKAQREVVFLINFTKYLKDYVASKITSDDYVYYKENIDTCRQLWNKYVDNRVLSLLDEYIVQADKFYKINTDRNIYFTKNMFKESDELNKIETEVEAKGDVNKIIENMKGVKEVDVVITGGFHSQTVTEILKNHGVSYIVITPNVTEGTKLAEETYYEIAKEQSKISFQAFANLITSLLPPSKQQEIFNLMSKKTKQRKKNIKKLSEEQRKEMIKIAAAKLLESDDAGDVLEEVKKELNKYTEEPISDKFLEKQGIKKIKKILEKDQQNISTILSTLNKTSTQQALVALNDMITQYIDLFKIKEEKLKSTRKGQLIEQINALPKLSEMHKKLLMSRGGKHNRILTELSEYDYENLEQYSEEQLENCLQLIKELWNISEITSADEVRKEIEISLAKVEMFFAFIGYSAPQGDYEKISLAVLAPLMDEISKILGKERFGILSSPTTDVGSIDATSTVLSQMYDALMVYVTAVDYLKYIEPEKFPDSEKFKEIEKFVGQLDKESLIRNGTNLTEFMNAFKFVAENGKVYSEAVAQTKNVPNFAVIIGGRATALEKDFMNAQKQKNNIFLINSRKLAKQSQAPAIEHKKVSDLSTPYILNNSVQFLLDIITLINDGLIKDGKLIRTAFFEFTEEEQSLFKNLEEKKKELNNKRKNLEANKNNISEKEKLEKEISKLEQEIDDIEKKLGSLKIFYNLLVQNPDIFENEKVLINFLIENKVKSVEDLEGLKIHVIDMNDENCKTDEQLKEEGKKTANKILEIVKKFIKKAKQFEKKDWIGSVISTEIEVQAFDLNYAIKEGYVDGPKKDFRGHEYYVLKSKFDKNKHFPARIYKSERDNKTLKARTDISVDPMFVIYSNGSVGFMSREKFDKIYRTSIGKSRTKGRLFKAIKNEQTVEVSFVEPMSIIDTDEGRDTVLPFDIVVKKDDSKPYSMSIAEFERIYPKEKNPEFYEQNKEEIVKRENAYKEFYGVEVKDVQTERKEQKTSQVDKSHERSLLKDVFKSLLSGFSEAKLIITNTAEDFVKNYHSNYRIGDSRIPIVKAFRAIFFVSLVIAVGILISSIMANPLNWLAILPLEILKVLAISGTAIVLPHQIYNVSKDIQISKALKKGDYRKVQQLKDSKLYIDEVAKLQKKIIEQMVGSQKAIDSLIEEFNISHENVTAKDWDAFVEFVIKKINDEIQKENKIRIQKEDNPYLEDNIDRFVEIKYPPLADYNWDLIKKLREDYYREDIKTFEISSMLINSFYEASKVNTDSFADFYRAINTNMDFVGMTRIYGFKENFKQFFLKNKDFLDEKINEQMLKFSIEQKRIIFFVLFEYVDISDAKEIRKSIQKLTSQQAKEVVDFLKSKNIEKIYPYSYDYAKKAKERGFFELLKDKVDSGKEAREKTVKTKSVQNRDVVGYINLVRTIITNLGFEFDPETGDVVYSGYKGEKYKEGGYPRPQALPIDKMTELVDKRNANVRHSLFKIVKKGVNGETIIEYYEIPEDISDISGVEMLKKITDEKIKPFLTLENENLLTPSLNKKEILRKQFAEEGVSDPDRLIEQLYNPKYGVYVCEEFKIEKEKKDADGKIKTEAETEYIMSSVDSDVDSGVWGTMIDTVLAAEILRGIKGTFKNVVELGTGAGHLAATMTKLDGVENVYVTDISPFALVASLSNILKTLEQGNAKAVDQAKKDLIKLIPVLGPGIQGLDFLKNAMDMIIVNPPYIDEPESFRGGKDLTAYGGTQFLREILENLAGLLNPNNPDAQAILSVSSTTRKALERYLADLGYNYIFEPVGTPQRAQLKVYDVTGNPQWIGWLLNEGMAYSNPNYQEEGTEQYSHDLVAYRVRLIKSQSAKDARSISFERFVKLNPVRGPTSIEEFDTALNNAFNGNKKAINKFLKDFSFGSKNKYQIWHSYLSDLKILSLEQQIKLLAAIIKIVEIEKKNGNYDKEVISIDLRKLQNIDLTELLSLDVDTIVNGLHYEIENGTIHISLETAESFKNNRIIELSKQVRQKYKKYGFSEYELKGLVIEALETNENLDNKMKKIIKNNGDGVLDFEDIENLKITNGWVRKYQSYVQNIVNSIFPQEEIKRLSALLSEEKNEKLKEQIKEEIKELKKKTIEEILNMFGGYENLDSMQATVLFYLCRDNGFFEEMIRLYEKTSVSAKEFKDSIEIRELYFVAFNKTGRYEETIKVLKELEQTNPDEMNGELYGALGKAYYVRYEQTKDPKDLELSYKAYNAGYEIDHYYYPGINAIYRLIDLADVENRQEKIEEAQNLAKLVYLSTQKAGGIRSGDYWTIITMVEAMAIGNLYDEKILDKALTFVKDDWQINSTLKNLENLERILEKNKQSRKDVEKIKNLKKIIDKMKQYKMNLGQSVQKEQTQKTQQTEEEKFTDALLSFCYRIPINSLHDSVTKHISGNYRFGGSLQEMQLGREDVKVAIEILEKYGLNKLDSDNLSAFMDVIDVIIRVQFRTYKDDEEFKELIEKIENLSEKLKNEAGLKKLVEDLKEIESKGLALENLKSGGHRIYDDTKDIIKEVTASNETTDSRTNIILDFLLGVGDCRQHGEIKQVFFDVWKEMQLHSYYEQARQHPEQYDTISKKIKELQNRQLLTMEALVKGNVTMNGTYSFVRDANGNLIYSGDINDIEEHVLNVLVEFDEEGNIKQDTVELADSFYQHEYKFGGENKEILGKDSFEYADGKLRIKAGTIVTVDPKTGEKRESQIYLTAPNAPYAGFESRVEKGGINSENYHKDTYGILFRGNPTVKDLLNRMFGISQINPLDLLRIENSVMRKNIDNLLLLLLQYFRDVVKKADAKVIDGIISPLLELAKIKDDKTKAIDVETLKEHLLSENSAYKTLMDLLLASPEQVLVMSDIFHTKGYYEDIRDNEINKETLPVIDTRLFDEKFNPNAAQLLDCLTDNARRTITERHFRSPREKIKLKVYDVQKDKLAKFFELAGKKVDISKIKEDAIIANTLQVPWEYLINDIQKYGYKEDGSWDKQNGSAIQAERKQFLVEQQTNGIAVSIATLKYLAQNKITDAHLALKLIHAGWCVNNYWGQEKKELALHLSHYDDLSYEEKRKDYIFLKAIAEYLQLDSSEIKQILSQLEKEYEIGEEKEETSEERVSEILSESGLPNATSAIIEENGSPKEITSISDLKAAIDWSKSHNFNELTVVVGGIDTEDIRDKFLDDVIIDKNGNRLTVGMNWLQTIASKEDLDEIRKYAQSQGVTLSMHVFAFTKDVIVNGEKKQILPTPSFNDNWYEMFKMQIDIAAQLGIKHVVTHAINDMSNKNIDAWVRLLKYSAIKGISIDFENDQVFLKEQEKDGATTNLFAKARKEGYIDYDSFIKFLNAIRARLTDEEKNYMGVTLDTTKAISSFTNNVKTRQEKLNKLTFDNLMEYINAVIKAGYKINIVHLSQFNLDKQMPTESVDGEQVEVFYDKSSISTNGIITPENLQILLNKLREYNPKVVILQETQADVVYPADKTANRVYTGETKEKAKTKSIHVDTAKSAVDTAKETISAHKSAQNVAIRLITTSKEIEILLKEGLSLNENLVIARTEVEAEILRKQGINAMSIVISHDETGGETIGEKDGRAVRVKVRDGNLVFYIKKGTINKEEARTMLAKAIESGQKIKGLKNVTSISYSNDEGEMDDIINVIKTAYTDSIANPGKEIKLDMTKRKDVKKNTIKTICSNESNSTGSKIFFITEQQAQECKTEIEQMQQEGYEFIVTYNKGANIIKDGLEIIFNGVTIDATDIATAEDAKKLLERLKEIRLNKGINIKISVKFSTEVYSLLSNRDIFNEYGIRPVGSLGDNIKGKKDIEIDGEINEKIFEDILRDENIAGIIIDENSKKFISNNKDRIKEAKSKEKKYKKGLNAAMSTKFEYYIGSLEQLAQIIDSGVLSSDLSKAEKNMEKIRTLIGNKVFNKETENYINYQMKEKGNYEEVLGFIRGVVMNTLARNITGILTIDDEKFMKEIKTNEVQAILILTLQAMMQGKTMEELYKNFEGSDELSADRYLNSIRNKLNETMDKTLRENEFTIKKPTKGTLEKFNGIPELLMEEFKKEITVEKDIKLSVFAVRKMLAAA